MRGSHLMRLSTIPRAICGNSSMASTSGESEHVVLTFAGGDMDGRVLDSQSSVQNERTVVEMFLGGSNRGENGCDVKSLVSYRSVLDGRMAQDPKSQSHTKIHNYRVTARYVRRGVCHLRVEHKMHDVLSGPRLSALNDS